MRAYRILLHLYPASFRAEYGEEMSAVFARQLRSDGDAWLVLWVRTFVEILFNATAVHLDILRQDLRYTARALRRSPGFAITAVLVAALGIGANTAAFTMVDHVLIRPLPFAGQDRLIKLWEHQVVQGLNGDISPANYRDWKRMATSFETMGAYRSLSAILVEQGNPRQLDGAVVTSEMFPMLGVQPMFGRLFTEENDREGAAGTILLSYDLWQEEFARDRTILGRKVLVDGSPYTVIGVMPAGFFFPTRQARIWTPMRFAAKDFEDRTDTYLFGVARLTAGVSLEQARSEMGIVTGQLARLYPKELAHTDATLARLRDDVSPQALLMLKALLGAAFCVLLIACTNLANLLLARAVVRRRELAVRTALGAGRERLIRQMLTESLLLALLGGVLGVLIAGAALPLMVRLVPVSLPIAEIPQMDMRVLLFALLVTGATGMGFGIVPALRAGRGSDTNSLRENARSGGGRRERLRSVLVVAEVAGCLVLLVSSALLIKALWRIRSVDPGFRADNVLTLRTSLPMRKYEQATLRRAFYQRVLSRARQVPGVTGAAYVSFLPMIMRGGVWDVEIQGHPQDPANRQVASLRFVTPGYFSVLGTPFLAGRDVEESDTHEAPWVAVVSQSFASRYWPGENPLGHHFTFGTADRTVAGVVGDVRVRGLERSSEPQVYLPYQQVQDGSMPWYAPKDLVIRASGNVSALAPSLRRIIGEADPEQPVSDVRTLTDIVDAETGARAVQLQALGAFAAIAFFLAGLGINGLLSFTVSQRAQEIGVRIALGAGSGDILAMVLGQGVRLAVVGVIAGGALAYAAGRSMQALLAGVPPGDPTAFLTAAGLCVAMTVAGSLLPAVRALRVDPVMAIRAE